MNELIARINPQHAALGLLVLLIALVLAVTTVPIWSLNASYDEQIRRASQQLHQLKHQAAEDELLKPELERLRQKHLASGHALKSTTQAVAAAELQKLVKRLAGSNGAQVQSTQILPSREEEGFSRIGLKVRVRGELTSIVDTFYDIESNDVFLFMDDVSVRQGAVRRARGSTPGAQFDADFELIGYMRKSNDEA
jgi:general secretion pathway protein M